MLTAFHFSKKDQDNLNFIIAFYALFEIILASAFIRDSSQIASTDVELGILLATYMVTLLIFILISLFVWLTISSFVLNIHNAFKITDKGLHIRIFTFAYTWIFIPWTQITDIFSLSSDIKIGFMTYGLPIWGVTVENLPLWYQVLIFFPIKMILNLNRQPTILIHPALKGHQILIEAISKHVKNN